ncbi:MAG: DUF3575 domain-containing protein [Flavobacteriales bacterium]|jgi:hypothetical protein|nr:DUF3575 domain-containing protein [Flavobacteriales bacterium]
MKKISFFFVFILFVSYSYSQVNSLIKNSPFHFFDGTFHLSYEKVLLNKKSINLSGGFHLVENGWNNNNHQIGWTGELQVRKYLSKNIDLNQLEGFYVSPYFKGGYFRFDDDYGYYLAQYDENNNYIEDIWYPYGNSYEIKNYQLGLIMGYQFIFSDAISLEFLLGGGVQYADVNRNLSSNTPFDKSYTGVVPKVGFNFGASF